MSALIVYDSIFGNTATIAKSIGEELEPRYRVRLVPVSQARGLKFDDVELLVVGSPTRGFRPTPSISEFCESLDAREWSGVPAAAFDTRIELDSIHPAPLRWVVDAGGYAADRIAQMLGHKGLVLSGSTAGFFVTGTEGPLRDGEVERAKIWVRTLVGASVPA